MKLQAVITRGAPVVLQRAFDSQEFALEFLQTVVGGVLGVANPVFRPAEYYVQVPGKMVKVGPYVGVALRLTGVSREGRTAEQLQNALDELVALAERTIISAKEFGHVNEPLRLFVVIMLDGDVARPDGTYSSMLESAAHLV